jgi:hypothetical protein
MIQQVGVGWWEWVLAATEFSRRCDGNSRQQILAGGGMGNTRRWGYQTLEWAIDFTKRGGHGKYQAWWATLPSSGHCAPCALCPALPRLPRHLPSLTHLPWGKCSSSARVLPLIDQPPPFSRLLHAQTEFGGTESSLWLLFSSSSAAGPVAAPAAFVTQDQ